MRYLSADTVVKSMIHAKLYSCDTLLDRLSQHFEHVPLELGELIQEQEAMVRQGHLLQHGQLAAADQADIGDRVVGSPEREHSADGGAPAGQAGDVMDAGDLPRC